MIDEKDMPKNEDGWKEKLTPEQYALHKAQQEQRAEMFRNAVQPGAAAPPAPRAP